MRFRRRRFLLWVPFEIRTHQRGSDGIEEIRLRLKREAIKEQKKEKAEFNNKMDKLAKQRKAYRKRHKRPKGRKRGRKPMRRTSFKPRTLSNEET